MPIPINDKKTEINKPTTVKSNIYLKDFPTFSAGTQLNVCTKSKNTGKLNTKTFHKIAFPLKFNCATTKDKNTLFHFSQFVLKCVYTD